MQYIIELNFFIIYNFIKVKVYKIIFYIYMFLQLKVYVFYLGFLFIINVYLLSYYNTCIYIYT